MPFFSSFALPLARALLVASVLLRLPAVFAGADASVPVQTAPPLARPATAEPVASSPIDAMSLTALAGTLQVGDIVFIRVGALPFQKVAEATGSWTNHVGVVVDLSQEEPLIAESTFPLSRHATLSRFVARSQAGQMSVRRLASGLSPEQARRLADAAQRRLGIVYDTGFDLHSSRQFCSRFVREVVEEATGQQLGEVQTFAQLLAQRPGASLGFWRLWYFGRIPWERETVTPASVLNSPALRPVFDGAVEVVRTARSGAGG